eukprot:gb/GECH01011787.1/.p1 GENE.gb/GECH01011787.1/~~gb/GECH01011787.1/.p1  ORF type:complete len:496 (+),score=121.82 gb/GECH01011787.1/:1-1488(+)
MSQYKDTALPETDHGFDYDLVVIGGGSGGISCSRTAAEMGKKVALLDYVEPSPQGTTYGIGGTCVNVGCIPKKLMHRAAILGENIDDARTFGWDAASPVEHKWEQMVQSINNHIRSLNFGYRVDLRKKGIKYMNAFGELKDANTVETTDKKGKKQTITSRRFVVSVGGRPKLPDIPGAKEYGITSDDIFWMQNPPGKTLVVGASYVALECAGFLTGLGYDTTVMIRSIPLRGFDQQMAELIVEYMSNHKTRFVRGAVPSKLEKENGQIKVTYKKNLGGEDVEHFDTVLFATGRYPVTNIGLDNVGVETASNGKVKVNQYEQSSVPNIYSIGDCAEDRLELTPVAIHAGKLLARRLYGESSEPMNYDMVPTTVFTPLEYGACGLPEEQAREKYGDDNIEVYHSHFKPLEWTIPERETNACYLKVICNQADQGRVVGFHILSPNAGEVTQSVALGMKLGATKPDLEDTVGIHPTVAEEMTTVHVSKSSGEDPQKTGC